jgi:predicted acyltransferase
MVLGLLAGNILNSSIPASKKLNNFALYGIGLILIGAFIHFAGINPIVKRIWTPAWTIFSGGICFLSLAMFYGLIDMKNRKKGTFFLMVIGVNSIAAYVIADGGMRNVINDSLFIHLGKNFDQILGPAYATLISGGLVLFFEWLILYWMYKKKLFIKI